MCGVSPDEEIAHRTKHYLILMHNRQLVLHYWSFVETSVHKIKDAMTHDERKIKIDK